MADESAPPEQPIVIKKIVKGGGHHGGAWKVAYADFVTAMMAFFLLLWLLNVSTDEQLNAISNYFDPTHPKISDRVSGAGGVMGGLSMNVEGAMVTDVQPLTAQRPTGSPMNSFAAQREGDKTTNAEVERIKEDLRKQEQQRYEEAQSKIKQALAEDPGLAALAENLLVDMTPEGLRIQIVDQEGKSMFASGSAQMYEKTKKLMMKVAEIVKDLPNELSIRGHTDSVPYGPGADYTNWELSTDRAHSSRRVLIEGGLGTTRVNNVVGKADTEHLVPDDPTNAKNRRISIVLLKEELTDPDYNAKVADMASDGSVGEPSGEAAPAQDLPQAPPVGTFRRTPGEVEFP